MVRSIEVHVLIFKISQLLREQILVVKGGALTGRIDIVTRRLALLAFIEGDLAETFDDVRLGNSTLLFEREVIKFLLLLQPNLLARLAQILLGLVRLFLLSKLLEEL